MLKAGSIKRSEIRSPLGRLIPSVVGANVARPILTSEAQYAG